MKNSDNSIIKISDVVFTVTILIVALILLALIPSGIKGRTVVFRMDGEVLAELPLDKDAVYEVSGAYTNVFAIENSRVRVVKTDCPNHECERTGDIYTAGESIVCAPNRVSAAITGEGVPVDAISG